MNIQNNNGDLQLNDCIGRYNDMILFFFQNVCKVFQSKLAEPRTANEQSFLVSTISNLDHHGL